MRGFDSLWRFVLSNFKLGRQGSIKFVTTLTMFQTFSRLKSTNYNPSVFFKIEILMESKSVLL